MIEIKYRAYNKKFKKMAQVVVMDLFRGDVSIGDPDHKGYNENWPAEDIEIMQYTGLKDKNGVEIWEGDRVRTWIENHIPGGMETDIGWIVWDKCKGAWRVQSYTWWVGLDQAIFEVIGNIYENRELTKAGQNG